MKRKQREQALSKALDALELRGSGHLPAGAGVYDFTDSSVSAQLQVKTLNDVLTGLGFSARLVVLVQEVKK